MPYRSESDILTSALGAPSRAMQNRLWRPIYEHTFDGVTGDYNGLTNINGNVLVADTVNYRHSATAAGSEQSLKVVCDTGGTQSRFDLAFTSDLTDLWARYDHYIHAGTPGTITDGARVANTQLLLYAPGGGNYKLAGMFLNTGVPGPGWRSSIRPISEFTSVGSPDLSNMGELRFMVDTEAAADTPSISFDRCSFWLPVEQPMVIVTIDDGADDGWDAAVYAAKMGVPCTFFIHSDRVGRENYLTWEQLRAMEGRMGHLAANHGSDQVINGHNGWDAWSIADISYALRRGVHAMRQNGLRRGANILATPGGQFFPEDCALRGGTSDWENINGLVDLVRSTGQRECGPYGLWHPSYAPYVWGAANANAASETEDAVDEAIAYGGVAVSIFHAIVSADWRSAIDYIAAKQAAGQIVAGTMEALMQPIEPRRVWFVRGAEAANARTITIHTPTAYADVLVYAAEHGSRRRQGRANRHDQRQQDAARPDQRQRRGGNHDDERRQRRDVVSARRLSR